MTATVTVLGFDVGGKRIGVAVGNSISMTAREVGVLDMRESGPDWLQLDRWMREWRPEKLIVGDPLNLEHADQTSRQRAHRFARDIAERYQLPVEQVDERASSIEAAQRFAEARRAGARKRRQAAQLDALAAVIIVERWLAEPASRTPLDSTSTEPK